MIGNQAALLTVLAHPIRRALFAFVCRRDCEVGREEAARALGISKSLAAFHLDKLASEGLLDVGYKRLSGRSGPGAGRPAKIYRRSQREIAVQFPNRNYRLAAEVLLESLAREPARKKAVEAAARRVGSRIGRVASADLGRGSDALMAILEEIGFDPEATGRAIILRNCPFSPLAASSRETVCSMCLNLLKGIAEEVGAEAPKAKGPDEGACCAEFDTRSRSFF